MRRLAGYYLALASCWPAAVRPAGCTGRWRAGSLLVGWAGQRHRLNAARLVLGRYRRPLATHWQKVNLLNAFGPFGGLLATYLLLLIALLLVIALRDIFPPPCGGPDREGERMKNIIPDYRLDMVGEPCPYPAVATTEAMPSLQKGEILEVVSDCPQSINNIPLDARNHGYTVLDIQQDGPTIRYLIQK